VNSNLLHEKKEESFHIFFFDELSTTQEKVEEFEKQGRDTWTVVVTKTQTAGRGRFHNRDWFSPHGGLWFSVLLRPMINVDKLKGFSLLPSISSAWSIRKLTDLNVLIKWPNDIMVENKKIGGTVIESKINMKKNIYSVIGIGINANFLEEAFPQNLSTKATTILQHTGKEIQLEKLLVTILQKMHELYNMIIQGESFRLIEDYLNLSETIGKKVGIFNNQHQITGLAKCVGENGALILELPDGSRKKIEACEHLIYM
jgi:BirA family biotin operon repressor/biotin-[acetyl-CoA-carboxylase] ligase